MRRALVSMSRWWFGALVALAVAAPAEAADPRPPESSRILEVFETEADAATRGGGAPPLDLSGYRRADMIGHIYDGNFALVPATGLDNMRYYAQAVADLAGQCPNLRLESAKAQLIPYVLSGVGDLVHRFQTGKLSQSEILQAAWMAMLGLNEHWSCTYDPMGPESYESAQARCNQAGRTTAEAGVLPSLDAAQDVMLFLGRHGCDSAQARQLARRIIEFGRSAHTRLHFTERMPPPHSASGKAYSAIFENCARGSLDPTDHEWCGCYVRALHSLSPSLGLLRALAKNPFVDGATYMTWVARNLKGGGALYDCADVYRGKLDWRESYAPRPTACLIKEAATPGGARECQYRAAWGTFTTGGDTCPAEITSRRWGYREVDCAAGGTVAAAVAGPREWKSGVFTMIDYEAEVPPDFVPPLPEDVREKYPLEVRIRAREDTPSLLKSMSLVPLTEGDFMVMGMPFDQMMSLGPHIAAIDREGGLVLNCTYKASAGQRVHKYWYERVPGHVQEGRVPSGLHRYFARIEGPATTCPARDPAP